jgi:hypothetical protein
MRGLRWAGVKGVAVVMAMLLVAGCSAAGTGPGAQETAVAIEITPSPARVAEPAPSTEPVAAAGVTVSVSKVLYEIGEPVPVTITNHLDRDIFYDLVVVRIEDGMRIRLVETITEEVIPPVRLAAGETVSGAWDQVSWWAPEKEGIERFIHWTEESQVPPGPYQWVLMYGFTEEAAMRDPITVYSQAFTLAGNGEPGAGSDAVTVSVAKDVYSVGEVISYTIVNHSDKPIYYRYTGCDFPFIVQWVDDEEVVLVTNILEYEPRIKDIEPGGSLACGWDQTFYNGKGDPEVQNHRYQVRFLYAFTEEEVDVPDGLLMAVSQVFTIAGDGEPGAGGDPVTVSVAKDVYQVREVISYTIVNHSDQPIYYRYSGCGFPYIVQWVDDEEVRLAINITEEVPALRDIEPGGSLACSWDQTFHAIGGSDPDVQGHRYQVRFWYAFTEEDVDVQGGLVLMAVSQVFTIE